MQYFFQAEVHGQIHTLALVSVYSEPDAHLFQISSGALLVCDYYGTTSASTLQVIAVKNIASCIAMVPFGDNGHKYFVCEKMGLEVAFLGGSAEEFEGDQ